MRRLPAGLHHSVRDMRADVSVAGCWELLPGSVHAAAKSGDMVDRIEATQDHNVSQRF